MSQSPMAAPNPITALSDTASTVTSTDKCLELNE